MALPWAVALEGHLTRAALSNALAPYASVRASLVLVDCMRMTGYDLDARHAFVEWLKQNGSVIDRVAIVTENRVWHMVVATMSLISRREMQAFMSLAEAEVWLARAA